MRAPPFPFIIYIFISFYHFPSISRLRLRLRHCLPPAAGNDNMKCAMVGLSVLFETRKLAATDSTPQIIQKSTLIMNTNNHHHHRRRHRRLCSSPPTPRFLDRCFLCRLQLLPGKDIFMYEGDKGFCSEECRCRQIFMDEEQCMPDAGNCSIAAVFNPQTTASQPSPSSPPYRHPKPTGNHARGFVY